MIKKLGHRAEFVLPDRAAVTMAVPFMRSYCELLVKTCHNRGAHAMGGMAAFIPLAARPGGECRRGALAKVRRAEDKEREASQGFDGTWVAHPDLRAGGTEAFDAVLGERLNQIERQRDDVHPDDSALLDVAATPGEVTGGRPSQQRLRGHPVPGRLAARQRRRRHLQPHGGRRDCGDLSLQIWQWLHHGRVSADDVRRITGEEVAKLGPGYDEARAIFEQIATQPDYVEFLTLPAYERLVASEH